MSWDPPGIVAPALGLAILVAWLLLDPPPRGVRGILRGAAAALLALALVDAGCGRAGAAGAPRLALLLDRSLSMTETSRDTAADAWGREVAPPGWTVERDTFGGTTTDLAGAIARAEAGLPDAILVISDGRAAGGRAAEAPAAPLYAHAPAPLAVADLAVVDVTLEESSGGTRARVELAAAGGLRVPARPVEVAVDGRVIARGGAGGGTLLPGERRVAVLELPRLGPGALVEARLAGEDAVGSNDRRARVAGPGAGPERTLLVGLRPGWEMGFVRRTLETAGPVDGVLATAPGRVTLLDRPGGVAWGSLDPGSYRAAWLFGDPSLLGAEGRAWVEAFTARGRGVAWLPGGYGGALAGAGATVSASSGASGVPALTESGRRRLAALGAPPAPAPGDPGTEWPPLELLPPPAAPPAGAEVWLTAGGRPAAWTAERGAGRVAVLLGTGYYRWRLAPAGAGPRFWGAWVAALDRWLAGAAAADRPLVRMPPGGRLARGDSLVAPVVSPARLVWRIERAEDGAVVASGVAEPDTAPGTIRAGGLAPGAYRLVAGNRAAPFVVESWAPDLAWTASDTASLAAAARASGGALVARPAELAAALERLPRAGGAPSAEGLAARAFGLGTTPWAYLAVALLLLAEWALGRRALASPPPQG